MSINFSQDSFYRLDQIDASGECPQCRKDSHFTFRWITPVETVRDLFQKSNGARKLGTTTVWTCDSCLAYLYVEWFMDNPHETSPKYSNHKVINPKFHSFNYQYVPADVKADLEEALKCLSLDCYNAFAAMCRRTVQTICSQAGVDGDDRIKKQLKEFKSISGMDPADSDAKALDAIILDGHDGAHPHLPSLNSDRAELLLILLQDVVDNFYNRPGMIAEAQKLRTKAIQEKSAQPPTV